MRAKRVSGKHVGAHAAKAGLASVLVSLCVFTGAFFTILHESSSSEAGPPPSNDARPGDADAGPLTAVPPRTSLGMDAERCDLAPDAAEALPDPCVQRPAP